MAGNNSELALQGVGNLLRDANYGSEFLKMGIKCECKRDFETFHDRSAGTIRKTPSLIAIPSKDIPRGAEICFGNSLNTCHVLLQERLASGNGDSVAFADFCECQKFVNDVVCCDQWLTILSNLSRGSGVVWITAHEVRKPSARVHKNSH